MNRLPHFGSSSGIGGLTFTFGEYSMLSSAEAIVSFGPMRRGLGGRGGAAIQ